MNALRISFAFISTAATAILGAPRLSSSAPRFTSAPIRAQAQPAQQTVAPPSGQISRSPLHMALPRREYLCAGGARIVVQIETNAARLTLNEHTYPMKQVPTGPSETKYADGSAVWSSTGDDGFLVDNGDSSKPKMLAEGCHLQSAYPPVAPAGGVIKGTATFGKHPALPADAVLIVQLRDLSHDADDPAALLAEERIPLRGRTSPISFALKFDPAKSPEKIPPAVSASITGRGKLLFVLVRLVIIPDITNPTPVHLALSRATPGKGQPTAPPVPEAPPHL